MGHYTEWLTKRIGEEYANQLNSEDMEKVLTEYFLKMPEGKIPKLEYIKWIHNFFEAMVMTDLTVSKAAEKLCDFLCKETIGGTFTVD